MKKVTVKKAVTLVMVFVLTFSLVACSAKEPTETTSGSSDTFEFTKPIKLVCCFGPGSAGDIYSRAFAKIAEKYVGQQIVVENKEGGSGSVGINYMLLQPADGYTIGYQSNTFAFTIAANQIDIKPSDVTPLAIFAADYHIFSVLSNDDRFETLEDVVNYAKANPGKLNMGGAQTKGNNHVFSLKIMQDGDFDANYIPYDNGGKSVLGLLGGNVDTLSSTSSVVSQQIEAGEIRPLAITLSERSPDFPDVPTFTELGFLSLDNYTSWKGFFISPEVPKEAITKWDAAIKSTVEDSEWIAFLEQEKQINQYMDSTEFREYFDKYVEDGRKLFEGLD